MLGSTTASKFYHDEFNGYSRDIEVFYSKNEHGKVTKNILVDFKVGKKKFSVHKYLESGHYNGFTVMYDSRYKAKNPLFLCDTKNLTFHGIVTKEEIGWVNRTQFMREHP